MSWSEAQYTIDEIKNGLIAGIPPLSPKTFRVTASNGKNKIYLVGPDDTVLDGQEICHAGGY